MEDPHHQTCSQRSDYPGRPEWLGLFDEHNILNHDTIESYNDRYGRYKTMFCTVVIRKWAFMFSSLESPSLSSAVAD